jgi:hypothetical protein
LPPSGRPADETSDDEARSDRSTAAYFLIPHAAALLGVATCRGPAGDTMFERALLVAGAGLGLGAIVGRRSRRARIFGRSGLAERGRMREVVRHRDGLPPSVQPRGCVGGFRPPDWAPSRKRHLRIAAAPHLSGYVMLIAIALVTVSIVVGVYAMTLWLDSPASDATGEGRFDA